MDGYRKTERQKAEAYEAAKAHILRLDAEARIADPRLSKGNYKGSVLAVVDDFAIQQLREGSYIIHDLENLPGIVDRAIAEAFKSGSEVQYRFIYKDGIGSIEIVDLEVDVKQSIESIIVKEKQASIVGASIINSKAEEVNNTLSQKLTPNQSLELSRLVGSGNVTAETEYDFENE